MHAISLDDIRLFVAVVQSGSLTATSELTGIPISRLSRRLTELEKQLGTQLINRGKKGVSLHEMGEAFFLHAQNMLTEAELAIGSIHQGLQMPAGTLKISLPIDLADLLRPNLHEYLARYPQVSLEISLTQQKINMIQDGIDVAIRAGTINNEQVVAKTLTMLDFGIFASDDYITSHILPQTPDELYQHSIIAQSLTTPWVFYHTNDPNQKITISPKSMVAVNDFGLVAGLIAQGLGIGLLPTRMTTKHTNLRQILTDWQLPSSPLSVIYYKNRGGVLTVRSFVDWLLTQEQVLYLLGN